LTKGCLQPLKGSAKKGSAKSDFGPVAAAGCSACGIFGGGVAADLLRVAASTEVAVGGGAGGGVCATLVPC